MAGLRHLTTLTILTCAISFVFAASAQAQQRKQQRGRGDNRRGGDRSGSRLDISNEYLQQELRLTVTQKKRIKEIELQMAGVRALLREDIVQALRITDTQKQKIEDLLRAGRQGDRQGERKRRGQGEQRGQRVEGQVVQQDRQGKGNRQRGERQGEQRDRRGKGGGKGGKGQGKGERGRGGRGGAVSPETTKQVLAVLTNSQRSQFERMKGRPVDLEKMRQRRGGDNSRPRQRPEI